ncbi:MAG: isocitrate/isopropylmalate family dehydrogenase, partial [Desulfobacterales bacterium]|nr:isocitrate/isopropylmalate family dehydrogenase [Desulfobacterales bacterium]
MKTYQMVVLPGDGIGQEIVDAMFEVLETLKRLFDKFRLGYDSRKAGAQTYVETREIKTMARRGPPRTNSLVR